MNTENHAFSLRLQGAPDFFETLKPHLEAADTALEITGFGLLDDALIDASFGRLAPRSVSGPVTVASLQGRWRPGAAEPLTVVVVAFRENEFGLVHVGGRLLMAGVQWMDLVVRPYPPQGPSDAVKPESAPVAPRAATAEAADPWQRLADTSQHLDTAHPLDADEGLLPAVGDRVLHQQFGECTVVKLTDVHAMLQKSDGRVVQLGLSVLTFVPLSDESGRAQWRIQVKKAGRR